MSGDVVVRLRVDGAEARPARWWATVNTLSSWAAQSIAMVPESAPPPYGGRYAAPLDLPSRGRRAAP